MQITRETTIRFKL